MYWLIDTQKKSIRKIFGRRSFVLVLTFRCLNKRILSYRYRNSHYKVKTVSRPSYLYNGNPIPKKAAFILRQNLASRDMMTSWQRTFPRYWPFVRRNHQSSADSSHKGPSNAELWYFLLMLARRSCRQTAKWTVLWDAHITNESPYGSSFVVWCSGYLTADFTHILLGDFTDVKQSYDSSMPPKQPWILINFSDAWDGIFCFGGQYHV